MRGLYNFTLTLSKGTSSKQIELGKQQRQWIVILITLPELWTWFKEC